LAQLEGPARAGHSAEFFTALNRALQEQLALTLGGAAGAFTEDVVTGRLEPAGLDQADAAALRGLFEAMAQARYSPITSQTELAKLVESARGAIGALRNLEGER
jgi:hypothetical protein